MGGIGGGTTFGAGGAGGLFGSGQTAPIENDPYANIAIDLNKVKKSEPPPKLHELKTEEEKKREAEAKKTSSTTVSKSVLKRDFEDKKAKGSGADDEDAESKRKRSVSFGKSTTYEVERADSEVSTEFINKEGAGGKGSPRPAKDKKVIAEKDLSDGRSEKERILEMLEKRQREELEEIQALNELSKGRAEDSIGESSSMSNNKLAQLERKGGPSAKEAETSNSYESDDFEDVSASGSGSKSKLVHWPGKQAFEKQKPLLPP